MSDEIAQAPKEEYNYTRAQPNTHPDISSIPKPDTYGKLATFSTQAPLYIKGRADGPPDIETTPSTVSTFPESAQNVPASTQAYNPSNSTIAISGDGLPPSTDKDAIQPKHLETPNVPKRSSSRAQNTSADSPPSMPDSSAKNSTTVPKKGSKDSLKPKSRSGSLASSGSKQGAGAAGGQESGAAEPKSKRRGGLLSCLNCFRSSEDANQYELGEQAVPAKKAKVLQQKPGRQPTPVVKPTSEVAEENQTETKKTAEEGIGGPEYSELKSAAKPKMITRSSKEKVSEEKPSASGAAASKAQDLPETPAPAVTREPPLPPLPQSATPPASEPEQRREAPLPKAAVTQAEPPQIAMPEESVAVQGTTINDRTPIQEAQDSDVAMPDAPPLPAAKDVPAQNTRQELAQTQMALPPPPPRNGQDRSTPSNATPNEKQQWLLPPLRPDFKGRKCLVLDLDETLVHSSFKVRSIHPLLKLSDSFQMLHQADFTIPVEIEGQIHNVYVIKRPGVDQFMKRVGELYEVVVFTASVSKVGWYYCSFGRC